MYDLGRLDLGQILKCGAAIRRIGEEAASMEDVAKGAVRLLHRDLVDGERHAPACALVRLFKTHPYGALDRGLQDLASGMLDSPIADPSTRCLVLLGTAGDQPDWNERTRSHGHQAIPLESVQALERAPMISQLIKQLGLEHDQVLRPDPGFVVDLAQRSFGVFHVAEAAGSAFIPAQEFVRRFGVRSVVGFGGVLPSGDLFSMILFSRLSLSSETAEMFSPLALCMKLALLPFDGGGVFTRDGARGHLRCAREILDPLPARVAALEQLLQVEERIVLEQSDRLKTTLHQWRTLAEAKSALAAIVEASQDAILTMSEKGIVETMNGAASRMFGYAPAEVLDGPMPRLIPERHREGHAEGLERYLRTGESRIVGRTVEVEGLRKDGSIVPLEISISEMPLGERRVFTGILRDITERKANERVLQETNRKLAAALEQLGRTQQEVIQQERLLAIGTMASGIAHDFNNSLAAILGFAELLLVRPEVLADPSSVRRYVDRIRTSAIGASAVVRRLREFYRKGDEAEVRLPVVWNKVVEDAISLTQPRWRDMAQAQGIDIQVDADLAVDLPAAPANEAELREVLINLLLNAVDAMPSGGRVTISTRSAGRCVVVEVRDTGHGMTEEVRRHCLEPFFTTKGAHGSGLGLASAYGAMQRHHGTIEIESAPGEGTCVRLAIPALCADLPIPRKAAESGQVGPLRVLVVDDEPLVVEVVSGYLSAVGHEVEVASNGREGLEKFSAGQFQLVVTDLGMPEMTGDQLAAAISRARPGTPVIMLTGWGDQMNAAGARPEGVDLILSKPITLTALVDAVGAVVSAARVLCPAL